VSSLRRDAARGAQEEGVMSLDSWIEDGFGGEDRRRYEEACSERRKEPRERVLTPKAQAEWDQHEKEAAAMQARLQEDATPVTPFDAFLDWLFGVR
jgi:hypothetical protein